MKSSNVERPPGFLDHVLICESVLRNTITALSYGAGREMLCYWLGVELQTGTETKSAVVLTAAFPQVESAYAQFRVVEGQIGLITSWCAERRLWILAQVHTHPTDEPHSEADECWPASHRAGFLSIVFPFFASMSSVRNPAWRAYECRGGGICAPIDPESKFQVLPDVWLPPSPSRRHNP